MNVQIIRSRRRKKTVEVREIEGGLEVLAPSWMSDTELAPVIQKLKKRIDRKRQASRLDEVALQKRAQRLNRRYFNGRLIWHSIRWVSNQTKCHGSCTPARAEIRISHRIASMPGFVLDYVLIHELAHLIEPNHSKRFWKLVYAYPLTERARGYLMAVGLEALDDGT